jgi:site-specific recombinase XerC
VRRLAYEAADSGLLSPDLAAGIRRVKGAKRLGVGVGNWLTAEQAQALIQRPVVESLRSKRDRAMSVVLLGCGLRRAELVGLKFEDLQIREEHRIIADLIGKGRHIRTVSVPAWVKTVIDDWIAASGADGGIMFGRVNRTGGVWGEGITPKAVWHLVSSIIQKRRNLSIWPKAKQYHPRRRRMVRPVI